MPQRGWDASPKKQSGLDRVLIGRELSPAIVSDFVSRQGAREWGRVPENGSVLAQGSGMNSVLVGTGF